MHEPRLARHQGSPTGAEGEWWLTPAPRPRCISSHWDGHHVHLGLEGRAGVSRESLRLRERVRFGPLGDALRAESLLPLSNGVPLATRIAFRGVRTSDVGRGEDEALPRVRPPLRDTHAAVGAFEAIPRIRDEVGGRRRGRRPQKPVDEELGLRQLSFRGDEGGAPEETFRDHGVTDECTINHSRLH